MPPTPVPKFNPEHFYYIAPEIVLAAWGLLVLIVDIGFFREWASAARRRALGVLSLVGVFASLVSVYFVSNAYFPKLYADANPAIFFGTIAGNDLTRSMNLVVLLLLAGVIALSMAWSFTEHWGEYFALLLWATVGMMLLIAAEELLTLFLTLETMTLCLYLMAAFEKTRLRSAEAGLKYFVYGSVSSALFLFGLSLIYGLAGTTRLESIHLVLMGGVRQPLTGLGGNVAGAIAVLLVMVGFGFKIAAVPFHQWAPDTYEGAPAPVTAWIASGSKIASFVALMKVMVHALGSWAQPGSDVTGPGWIGFLAIIAALTMTYGNFAALAQKNLKRLLAYSSIAHAGYMLVGVLAASASTHQPIAAGAVLFYLVVYGATTVGVFALAGWLARDKNSDDVNDLNGFAYQSPFMAVCVVLLMLSLIGMPPLAGFFAKVYLFMEALDTRNPGHVALMWLVALVLANSVVSAFYYVRVLKAMFLRPPGKTSLSAAPASISVPIVFATIVTVAFGLYPAPLLDSMQVAATPMFAEMRGTPYLLRDRFKTDIDPATILNDEQRQKKLEAQLKAMPRPVGAGLGGAAPAPPAGAAGKAAPKGKRAPRTKDQTKPAP
jgi:NADH-quinone oxidoreductase subunit N